MQQLRTCRAEFIALLLLTAMLQLPHLRVRALSRQGMQHLQLNLLLLLLLLLRRLRLPDLQAIVKSIKDDALPLNSSALWTHHIAPSRPPGGSSGMPQILNTIQAYETATCTATTDRLKAPHFNSTGSSVWAAVHLVWFDPSPVPLLPGLSSRMPEIIIKNLFKLMRQPLAQQPRVTRQHHITNVLVVVYAQPCICLG
jgi:hypothetical protein